MPVTLSEPNAAESPASAHTVHQHLHSSGNMPHKKLVVCLSFLTKLSLLPRTAKRESGGMMREVTESEKGTLKKIIKPKMLRVALNATFLYHIELM